MHNAILERFLTSTLLLLVVSTIAQATPATGHVLEFVLRDEESAARPFVVRLPLDALQARQVLDSPTDVIRSFLLEARQAHARSLGYETPAFRGNVHTIPRLAGWRWRLFAPNSSSPVAEGGRRRRPGR